jgi:hypothetical protein
MKYVIVPLLTLFFSISSHAQVGKWILKKYATEPDITESLSAFEKEAAKIYLKNKTKGSYYDVHKDGTFEAKGIYKEQMVDQKGTWSLSKDKKTMTLTFKYNGRDVVDQIEIRSISNKEFVVAKNSKEYGYDVIVILYLKKA